MCDKNELKKEELKDVTGGNSWNEYWGEDNSGDSGRPILPEVDRKPGQKWNDYFGEI